MFGEIVERLVCVVVRFWAFGMVFLLNNRLIAWLNGLKAPSIQSHRQKSSKIQEEDAIFYSKKRKSSPWNNLILMNLFTSKNPVMKYSQLTSMFLPHKTNQVPTIKDKYNNTELFISWDIPCMQNSKDFDIYIQECSEFNDAKNSVPYGSFSGNFSVKNSLFGLARPGEQDNKFYQYFVQGNRILCEEMYQQSQVKDQNLDNNKERFSTAELENNFKNSPCFYYLSMDKQASMARNSKDVFCCARNIKDCMCDNFVCKDEEKLNKLDGLCQEDIKYPKETHCSSAASIDSGFTSFCSVNMSSVEIDGNFLCKDKEKLNKLDGLCQEDTKYPKETHCSSAASIDSGFTSFCSVNMSSVEIDGIVIYLSDVCHDNDGKVIAMNVGFSAEIDSDESDSIFSDEEDCTSIVNDVSVGDNIEYSDTDNSDEDFIVFDTVPCLAREQFANCLGEVTMTFDMPFDGTYEFKMSQNNKYIYDNIDGKREQEESKTKENLDVIEESKFKQDIHSADTKKVHFNTDIEVHKFIKWEYAYRQARLGPWRDLATDRLHFQRRISEVGNVLEPVLLQKAATMNSKKLCKKHQNILNY